MFLAALHDSKVCKAQLLFFMVLAGQCPSLNVTRSGKRHIVHTWCQNTDFINIQKLNQYMCVLFPTANQSAFSLAAFSGLSDIHKHSGSPQLTLVAIGEEQPGCNMLCIDLAIFWTLWSLIWSHLEVQIHDTLFNPSTPWLPLPNQPPHIDHLWYWWEKLF